MIQGHGSSNPKAFFVSDGPVGEDEKSNYAITGYSGKLLNDLLRASSHKSSIEDFYRTCLIKEPLPKTDDKKNSKTHELIEQYKPILREEINALRPNLIIPINEWAFRTLTGLSGIRKFRGSVLPLSNDFPVDPTIQNPKVLPILGANPFLNQDYKLRMLTRIDVEKIPRYTNDAPIPDDYYKIWVARTASALQNFIDRSFDECMRRKGFLVFDIETYFGVPYCISLCFDGYESVTVPFADPSIDRDNKVLMLIKVARLLASPIPKVNQNIKYDWKIQNRWNFYVNNIIGDTMLASSCLYCEFPKNLGFLTSIYTDLPYFKDEGKKADPNSGKRDRVYLYCAKDSLATSQIYTKQQTEIDELGVRNVYNQVMKCLPIFKKMEDRGIRIDMEANFSLRCKYESLYNIELIKLRTLVNRQYVNPRSHVQCREIIYNECGYTKIRGVKTNEDGSPGTDEDSLDILLASGIAKRAPSTGPQILRSIIGARKISKVLEILDLPLHPDKRFRAEWNLAGTENGRTSGSVTTDMFLYFDDSKKEQKVKGVDLGHSLQTIGKHGFSLNGRTLGKDLRSQYVPSPGMVFVEIDLSGAEARVDAVLAKCYDLLPVFDNGTGIHRLTGSWIYNCDPSEIKKGVLVDGVDRYHVSKQIRHSGERNIQAPSLHTKFLPDVPLPDCVRHLKEFHVKQPEIVQVFHKEIITAMNAPGHCLVAPNGRRRDFFDRIDQRTYNEGFSFLPQCIVGDQMKFEGIMKSDDLAESCNAWLLTEQHDGGMYEVPKDNWERLAIGFKKNVEVPIDFRSCTLSRDFELTIPSDVSYSEENWYDMKEIKI